MTSDLAKTIKSVKVKTSGPDSGVFDVSVGDRIKFYIEGTTKGLAEGFTEGTTEGFTEVSTSKVSKLLIGSVLSIKEDKEGPSFLVEVKEGKPVNHDLFSSFNLDVTFKSEANKRKFQKTYLVNLSQVKVIYKIMFKSFLGVNTEFITKEVTLIHF